MSHSTGIIFNDQMRDFDYTVLGKRLNKNNLIKAGKTLHAFIYLWYNLSYGI